jgi:hypothetical protein
VTARRVGLPSELNVQSSNAARAENPDDFQDKVEIRNKFNALREYLEDHVDDTGAHGGGSALTVTDGSTTIEAVSEIAFDGTDLSVTSGGPGFAQVSLNNPAPSVTDGTTSVIQPPTIEFDEDFFDVQDISGDAYVTFVGSSGGVLNVTDGTTDVDPATTITFDPTYFDVTDGGSGEAEVTFVGPSGGDLNVTDGTTDVDPTTTITFDPTYFDVTDGGSDEAEVTLITTPFNGSIWPAVKPPSTGWSWVNQGSCTITTDTDGALMLYGPSNGATNSLRMRVRTFADPDNFDVRIGCILNMGPVAHMWGGLVLRESATAKLQDMRFGTRFGTLGQVEAANDRWTNPTTFGSTPWNPGNDPEIFLQPGPFYFRARRASAGNIFFSYSLDGRFWHEVLNHGAATHFTTEPDEWGIVINPYGGECNMTLFHFYEA